MTPPTSPQQNSQATEVTYAGQNEEQLRAEYERIREQNPGLLGAITTFDDYLRYQQQSAKYQQDQERRLEQVVENYRPPMSSSCSYYLGYDHKELKTMVTDNMAPSTANEQGEAWTKIGNTLAQLQNDLTSATNASKGAWQGQAAEAAQGYFANVATWSGNAAQGAQLTGNKLYAQSQAAETAKNSMPEPVEFSTADAYKMFFSEPNPFKWAETIDEIEQKFEEKQQAHERAAEVMTTMSSSFQESSSAMPAFSAPPAMSGTGGSGENNNTGTGEIGGRPTVPSGVGSGTGTGGTGDLGVPGGGGGVPGGGGGGGGGGNTNQSGWNGPGHTLPGAPGYIPPGGGGGGGGGGNNNLPGIYPPGVYPPGTGPNRPGMPGPNRPGMPGPGRPGMPGGGGGGGAGGGRGGGGLGGPGGLAAAGRGGMGGGLGGFGPGGSAGALGEAGRAGAGAGFGPGGSGGLGGAGAAGRGGAAGMGAMGGMGAGAGAGRGDEDKEHKAASYLVETEDVFGDGTMVAPPVIGG